MNYHPLVLLSGLVPYEDSDSEAESETEEAEPAEEEAVDASVDFDESDDSLPDSCEGMETEGTFWAKFQPYLCEPLVSAIC